MTSDPSSPVVPSVGAVPVEVPEDGLASDVVEEISAAVHVLVLNVGGYIGESTRSEIEYATAHGKPISYLESPASTTTCPHGLTVPHEDSSFVTGVTSRCPGPVTTPTGPGTCPKCRHAAHGPVCFNMASDNDCACRWAEPSAERDGER